MPYRTYLSTWWNHRGYSQCKQRGSVKLSACFYSSKALYLEIFASDTLGDWETGLWFAVFINLCVFVFCFHRVYIYDFIYLIACLHSIGLTLKAHLHHHLLKWDSTVWLDWLVVRTKGCVSEVWGQSISFTSNCFPFYVQIVSDNGGLKVFREEILKCSPLPSLGTVYKGTSDRCDIPSSMEATSPT